MRKGIRIRWLLLGVNAVVLLLPLIALGTLEIYEAYLLRQTERQLTAESAVIAEVFREAWRRETGVRDDDHKPPAARGAQYAPVEPQLDLGVLVLGPQPAPTRFATERDTPALRAGKQIEPLLRRSQTFNLSAVRVLDAQGCVVATTRSEDGVCMSELPEVRAALAGRYASLARERISDEPKPPLGDMRRRGTRRVFIALPVFSNGEVIAVVRASRTGLDALSSLWANRRGLLGVAATIGSITLLISLVFSTAIAWPLRRLTRAAEAVAEGRPEPSLPLSGFAPSEIHTLAEVLDGMTRKLAARASYVSEFANNVSHELKTPITSIRGAAELLEQDWAAMSDAERRTFLGNIGHDVARMERLVNRLLELARVESAVPEAGETIAVAEFFEALAERYAPNVVLELDAPPAEIRMPEDQLVTIVVNLLDNALRHGAGKPVRLAVHGTARELRIEVEDGGSGVSPGNRARVFDRFFTTERDRGGTGLGLSIVKALVEARGGSIVLAPGRADRGACFVVTLPS